MFYTQMKIHYLMRVILFSLCPPLLCRKNDGYGTPITNDGFKMTQCLT